MNIEVCVENFCNRSGWMSLLLFYSCARLYYWSRCLQCTSVTGRDTPKESMACSGITDTSQLSELSVNSHNYFSLIA